MTPLAYFSPSNIFPSLREKPEFLLPETDLNTIVLVDDVYNTKAVSMLDYEAFYRNNIFMKVDVEINDNSSLVDADTLEVSIISGETVDVGTKIEEPVQVKEITFETDNQLLKNDSFLKGQNFAIADKAVIVKDSFTEQKDGTFWVSKFITFPLYNSAVSKVTNKTKNTAYDNYYAVSIKPNGAFIGNANVKVSVQFIYASMDMGNIASINKMKGM